MEAFEQVVSEILWMEGYWVRTSVKVELTKKDKISIGRPSSPRWELDIVAYRAVTISSGWLNARATSTLVEWP